MLEHYLFHVTIPLYLYIFFESLANIFEKLF